MTGPPIESKWGSPFDKGFTNAVLKVESFQTEGRYSIPERAVFLVYAPKANGVSTNDLQLLRSYAIYATNISFSTIADDLKPKVAGRILVTDRRFERDRNPVYEVIYRFDNQWLSDDEVRCSS
ncbi:MAG: hypothetical protein HY298_15600 [Verrucomicrobia bacterium]|nr:hypothetical protein [Verrucomicrobiota bacterium]